MSNEAKLFELMATYVSADEVKPDDIIFGSGLDMSSIAFTEFVMDVEETYDLDIDIDDLDASIKTAGQLIERLLTYFDA